MRTCPFCAEQIPEAAGRCPLCGEALGPSPGATPHIVQSAPLPTALPTGSQDVPAAPPARSPSVSTDSRAGRGNRLPVRIAGYAGLIALLGLGSYIVGQWRSGSDQQETTKPSTLPEPERNLGAIQRPPTEQDRQAVAVAPSQWDSDEGTVEGVRPEPCKVASSAEPGQESLLQRAKSLLAEKGETGVPASKVSDALSVLGSAARADPECAEVWSLLAYALYRRSYAPCSDNDYDDAVSAGQRALELAGDRETKAAVLRNLGRVLAARSRWAEALRQFEAALEMAPRNRESQTWLDDVAIVQRGPRPELLTAAETAVKGLALTAADLSGP
jgi:Flp pilus assembly protein TadD